MTHAEVQSLLAAVPWQRLEEALQIDVNEHIAVCAVCREELHFDLELEAGLAPLRKQRETAQDVLRKVRRPASTRSRPSGVVRSSRRLPSSRPATSIPAVAASFLLAGGVLACAFYAWTFRQDPDASLEAAAKNETRPEPGPAPGVPSDPNPANAPAKPGPLAATVENRDQEAATVLAPQQPELARTETVLAEKEAVAPKGLAQGKARLRPIAAGSPWSGRDSLRLADGAIGLDLFEADLRIVKLSGVPAGGISEVLAVSLGGGKNPARLTDLGMANQLPRSLVETDALPVESGHRFLFRLEQYGKEVHYVLNVSAHQPGECVDLEWNFVNVEQAQDLVAKATPQPPGLARPPKGDGIPPLGVMAAPEKRKKRP